MCGKNRRKTAAKILPPQTWQSYHLRKASVNATFGLSCWRINRSSCLFPRMPCISRAMRMRMTCRPSPIAARWSARPSMITWCANVSPATRWTTSFTWLEPMNRPPASWSAQTAWPSCPNIASWRGIQILTWRLELTDSRMVLRTEGNQDKELRLCVLICPLYEKELAPLDKARQYWHLEESVKVWSRFNLFIRGGSLLQRESSALLWLKYWSISSLRQKNRTQGHEHFGAQYGGTVADFALQQERLYWKERLLVNHTGLEVFNGLILVVWRWQRDWEIPNRTKKHCSLDFVC